MMVQVSVRRVGWLACTSGDAGGGQVKQDPGEEPEVQPGYMAWIVKAGVIAAPVTGVTASLASRVRARRRLLPDNEVTVQVSKPSAKSWLMTAMATTAAAVMPVVAGQIRTICARQQPRPLRLSSH
jgi:hypothetical protein